MKRVFSILCLFVYTLLIFSQTRESFLADSLYLEGCNYFQCQDFERAYNNFSRAKIFCAIDGKKERELDCLQFMAQCCYVYHDFKRCIKHCLSAIDVAKSLKDETKEYIFYCSLFDVYMKDCQLKSAMEVREALDSISNQTTNNMVIYGRMLELAQSAFQQGHIDLTEYYLLEAEKTFQKLTTDDQNQQIFTLCDSFCAFYLRIGQKEKALHYLRKQIDATNNPLFPNIAIKYRNYGRAAWIEAQMGKRDASFADLDSMKCGLESLDNTQSVDWFFYYYFLGQVYALFNEWDDSCGNYRIALSLFDSTWGYYNIEYYSAVRNLAIALSKVGQHAEAIEQSERCLTFWQEHFGEQSIEYAQALHFHGLVLGDADDEENGIKHYAKSIDVFRNYIGEQYKYVSVQEREGFWNSFSSVMCGMTAYAVKSSHTQDENTKTAYNALLMSKGSLLESDRSISDVVYAKCNADEQAVYREIMRLQKQIKDLSRDFEKNKTQISSLNSNLVSLDRQFAPVASRLGYTDFLQLDFDYVKNSLKQDEYIIDFIDYNSVDLTTDYAAFVIDRQHDYPRLMKIFTKEDLDKIKQDVPSRLLYQQPLVDKIVNLIFTPLSQYIPEGATVYYIPTGDLHQIALEAMPASDGKLLGDHYNFIRLSSAREVVRRSDVVQLKELDSIPNAVLYGGLQYSVDPVSMTDEASKYEDHPYFATRGGSVSKDGSVWQERRGMKIEVEEVEQILKAHNLSVKSFVGKEGTEESFLVMHQHAPQLLLIATHGFYYTPDAANKNEYLKGYTDAMSLSGLVLAGANTAWKGEPLPDGVLSGILTADKIAQMNLEGLDLVVLSACQTGQGQTTPEGIFGLQRAFKKAGAGTLIMTLWEAHDGATKDFVTFFFKELTENGWKKRDAFNKARDYVKTKYEDPYYWACFEMLD